ncbi:hypothetical protein [Neolewinella maritima]|nr:hypothetical protein [Neolewinella maritima]
MEKTTRTNADIVALNEEYDEVRMDLYYTSELHRLSSLSVYAGSEVWENFCENYIYPNGYELEDEHVLQAANVPITFLQKVGEAKEFCNPTRTQDIAFLHALADIGRRWKIAMDNLMALPEEEPTSTP